MKGAGRNFQIIFAILFKSAVLIKLINGPQKKNTKCVWTHIIYYI